MSLFRAEVQRFFARRFTLVMLLIVVALFAIIATATAINSHHPTDAEVAEARQQVAYQIEQQQQALTQCEAEHLNPPAQPNFPPDVPCDKLFGDYRPTVENYLPYQWTFATGMDSALYYFAGLVALFGFAVGASFVGAEWSSGGLANLLLWRPRRTATMGAKLGAMVGGQFAISVVLLAGWVGTMALIAATRGEFGHVTSGVAQSIALTAARGIVLGLFTSIMGFALASLGRRTAAALGFAIGYVVVVEIGGRLLLQALRVERPDRFELLNYVVAWLTQRVQFSGYCDYQAGGCGGDYYITMGNAATLFTVITVILLGLTFVSFARRDVT